MPRKRSTYTAEFKLQAVRMVTDQKLSVAEHEMYGNGIQKIVYDVVR